MSDPDIKKGLAGVYADTTSISKVNPETNSLLYRGYPVQELAATSFVVAGAASSRSHRATISTTPPTSCG